jgi:hypothetical protein
MATDAMHAMLVQRGRSVRLGIIFQQDRGRCAQRDSALLASGSSKTLGEPSTIPGDLNAGLGAACLNSTASQLTPNGGIDPSRDRWRLAHW